MIIQMMNRLVKKLGTRITLGGNKKKEESAFIRAQVKEFENSLESERASYWESKFDPEELQRRFHEAGITTEAREIDIRDFEMWMAENPSLVDFYQVSGEARIEKILEHYLSVRFLGIEETDVIIDIAAAGSPFAEALRQKKMNSYRLDLSYRPGLNGYEIGSDAGDIPVPEEFADVLTLHCAFECFQGGSDVSFALEARRILKRGGRLGIVPLYIDTIHFVKTSAWCDKREIMMEPGVPWLWRDDKYRAPFSRHYSPESFSERIVSRMNGMDMKVLRFMNLRELMEIYPGQRIYCYFMFTAVKP